VVEAIYEPPQSDHSDGISLTLPWTDEDKVNEVAGYCGLTQVGMIFSDLIDDGTGNGTVITKRHADSYFLSSVECIFAAEMQRRHPNYTKYAVNGKYGSKYVTCVISGDKDGNIDVTSYQVSDTLTSLQEAEIIEASKKPSVMRIKESIPHSRYVPEVFYKFKNEYNVVVKQSAKPTFPVEYLLVNVTHGFPQNPNPLFNPESAFPIENREGISPQTMAVFGKYINSNAGQLRQLLCDFHLLCFIRSTDTLSAEEFRELCNIVIHPNEDIHKLELLNGWQTLRVLSREADNSSTHNQSSSASRIISCRHCTFSNPSRNENCEMCGLPLR